MINKIMKIAFVSLIPRIFLILKKNLSHLNETMYVTFFMFSIMLHSYIIYLFKS